MHKSNSRIIENDTISILLPSQSHQETVIWLHGLGDTTKGFLQYFSDENLTPFPATTKIILPQATRKQVTINDGMYMTSWFDIKVFEFNRQCFEQNFSIGEIQESELRLKQILNEEIKILGNSKKVFIGGFSQGCCMSLIAGLQCTERIGGIIGVSGFLFPITQIHQSNKDTPIFLTHGQNDYLINYKEAQESYQPIINTKEQRIIFENHSEPEGEHQISFLTLQNIKSFFEKAKNQ